MTASLECPPLLFQPLQLHAGQAFLLSPCQGCKLGAAAWPTCVIGRGMHLP